MGILEEEFEEKDIKNLNPLVLAYVGDAVMTLFVRTKLLQTNEKVNKLNKMCTGIVNAKAQADLFLKIEPTLFEEEKEIANRARNTNMHHMAKNYSVMEYRYATALEAVLGYLFLTKKQERLNKILEDCV